MQHLCTDEFKRMSTDEDTVECAEELLSELRAINELRRLTKSSWSPTLKANAAALEARRQRLALQLNALRERTCDQFRAQHRLPPSIDQVRRKG